MLKELKIYEAGFADLITVAMVDDGVIDNFMGSDGSEEVEYIEAYACAMLRIVDLFISRVLINNKTRGDLINKIKIKFDNVD